jgi:CheY-like chemotaxis protein
LRDLLRRYLSDSGFRVTGVADAQEARAQLTSFAFDFIVLDVMMPGESGLDLTRALRADSAPVPVPRAIADRHGRAGRPDQRARTGRRRFSRQAVRAARAGAAHPQYPAAPRRTRGISAADRTSASPGSASILPAASCSATANSCG